MTTAKEFLNQKEAAEFLGVSQCWIIVHTKTGELPSRLVGRRRFYSTAKLREFIEGNDAPEGTRLNDGEPPQGQGA